MAARPIEYIVRQNKGIVVFLVSQKEVYFYSQKVAKYRYQVISSYVQCSMEKLAGDLLLGLKIVKLEILSTSFIDFLYNKLGESRSIFLGA